MPISRTETLTRFSVNIELLAGFDLSSPGKQTIFKIKTNAPAKINEQRRVTDKFNLFDCNVQPTSFIYNDYFENSFYVSVEIVKHI